VASLPASRARSLVERQDNDSKDPWSRLSARRSKPRHRHPVPRPRRLQGRV